MTIGDRIKNRRLELGLSADDLAQKLGKNRATIYRYEKGDIKDFPITILEPLAKALLTNPGYLLLGDEQSDESPKTRIPVLGRVAAGIPIEAQEEILDWEEITTEMAMDGDYFALQIKGDSMEPKFSNGDVVIVRQQEDADDGDIVIALIDGCDAVCKRLKKYQGGISLVSTNPAYEPMYFSGKEVTETPVRIIGKVKELRAKF